MDMERAFSHEDRDAMSRISIFKGIENAAEQGFHSRDTVDNLKI
jgi:hypothetical protein